MWRHSRHKNTDIYSVVIIKINITEEYCKLGMVDFLVIHLALIPWKAAVSCSGGIVYGSEKERQHYLSNTKTKFRITNASLGIKMLYMDASRQLSVWRISQTIFALHFVRNRNNYCFSWTTPVPTSENKTCGLNILTHITWPTESRREQPVYKYKKFAHIVTLAELICSIYHNLEALV